MLSTATPDYIGGVGTPQFGGNQPAQQGGGINPYIQAGGSALQQYLASLSGMKDPAAYMQHLMSGYSQSPSAKLQTQQAIGSANQAAAQSGMLGSGAAQSGIARQSQQIAQGDQQRYLQNLLGIHGQYTGGLSDISHMGEQGAMGQMQQQEEQARLAQQQQQFEEGRHDQQHQSMWSNIAGGLGGIGGVISHFL